MKYELEYEVITKTTGTFRHFRPLETHVFFSETLELKLEYSNILYKVHFVMFSETFFGKLEIELLSADMTFLT